MSSAAASLQFAFLMRRRVSGLFPLPISLLIVIFAAVSPWFRSGIHRGFAIIPPQFRRNFPVILKHISVFTIILLSFPRNFVVTSLPFRFCFAIVLELISPQFRSRFAIGNHENCKFSCSTRFFFIRS